MLELGECVYVEERICETLMSLHMSTVSFVPLTPLLSPCRLSEEAVSMWKKHLERDDSRIVGKQRNPVTIIYKNKVNAARH